MFPELSPPEMTEKLKRVLKYRNFNLKILNNVVGRNTADVTSIPISSVKQLDDVFENGIVFLGLVTPPDDSPFGTIFHYFLLRRGEEGYSILSSYGSTFIAMRQYQTPLDDPEELTLFIENLAKPTKDDKVKEGIDLFMRKYFLDTKYKTIQRKEKEDMEDTYRTIPHESDLRWLKNEPNDINKEVGIYLNGPTYVMLFPNMLDIFRAEIAALELKDAEKKLGSLDIAYDDYLAIHGASEKASLDAMMNITATKAKIDAAGIKISEEAEANIAATIKALTPDKLARAEGEAITDVQSGPMKTPQKVVPSREVLSPPSPFMTARLKRVRKGTPEKPDEAAEELTRDEEAEDAADAAKEEADKAEEAAGPTNQTPEELHELNELGLVYFEEGPRKGGKRTRKKKRKTKKRKSRTRK